jgi:signal transduction histidine kinase
MSETDSATADRCDAREVARFVRAERVMLVARWRERVLADPRIPSARHVTEATWIDHAPVLLDRLDHALEAACEPEADPEQLGRDAWQMPYARLHAEERFAHGYAIDEVLRELFQLRRAIFEMLTEARVPIDAIAQQVIDSAFSEAIAIAASETSRAQRGHDASERDRVIGIVSHDLRNPLHALKLGTEYLLRHGVLSEGQRGVAVRMRRSVDAMARMVADLLDVARARGLGAISIEPAEIELAVVLAEVVDHMRVIAPSRRIELASDDGLRGEWDATRLAQGLGNLLANALEYGDPTQPVRVTARADGDGVRIEVWNAGTPIPEEMLPRIFEPFRRGTRASRVGTGLGLYIAREIAAAHSGRLELESNATHGTVVRWMLPRRIC